MAVAESFLQHMVQALHVVIFVLETLAMPVGISIYLLVIRLMNHCMYSNETFRQ